MPTFPDQPVPPDEFIEDVIPSLFAEMELEPDEAAIDLRVGVVLQGGNPKSRQADVQYI